MSPAISISEEVCYGHVKPSVHNKYVTIATATCENLTVDVSRTVCKYVIVPHVCQVTKISQSSARKEAYCDQ